ncbi:MAG: hypothetical protein ACHQQQ_06245 [Bacteroidota bacterium]
MSSKIKIKIGEIEVDYEGEEKFLINELPNLLKALSELHKSSPNPTFDEQSAYASNIKLSINNVALKLRVKTGPELIMAACAHLEIVQGRTQYDQKAILNEMKTAKGLFKQTYAKHLAKYIRILVKNDLLTEPATGKYSIHHEKVAGLKAKLS